MVRAGSARSLRDSLFTRVRALPERTQQLLAVAAMSSRPTVALLARVFPGTEVLELVAAAELAGIATVGTVGSFARRAVFATLAGIGSGRIQPVARQRAASGARRRDRTMCSRAPVTWPGSVRTPVPVATATMPAMRVTLATVTPATVTTRRGSRQLADAAEARRRGATDLAVELAQAALALTPVAAVVELLERRRALAEYHNAAGDWSAALVDIQRVLAELGTPPAVIIDSSLRGSGCEQALHDLVPVLSRTDGYRAALVRRRRRWRW